FITKYNNHSLSLNTNSLKVSESESLRCFKVLLENMIFTSDKNIIDEDQVRINSTFAKNACLLDQGRKEAYWTDPTELFARVFEVWVSDKLKASGYINEFLVYGPDEPPSSWHTKVNTYPEDQERIRIVHYLDRWLSELVTTWKFEKKRKLTISRIMSKNSQ
ncbi:LPD1 domain-containing protein, partial [Acinetobacter baumannii]